MDPRDFFSFVRRRLVVTLVVLILGVVLGAGYTASFDPGHQGALIFLTIGMEVPDEFQSDLLTTNESHNVIDQFTETIQGWLYNPALLEKVNEEVGVPVGLSVRKQEKQNLLVSLDLPLGTDIDQAAQSVVRVLEGEIQSYNEATNMSFVLALTSLTSFETAPRWGLNMVVAGFLALVLVLVLSGLYEYSRRRLSFGFQVEGIVGHQPLLRLSPDFQTHDLDGFLTFYPKRFKEPVLLIEMGKIGLSRVKSFLKTKHSMEVYNYPSELPKYFKGQPIVVFVKLGESTEDHLRELKLLRETSFDYILIV